MPQTVPNRPMNGAVEPTEASIARPDCRRAVNASMQLRRQRVTQSLMSRWSCRWAGVVRVRAQLGQGGGKVFAVPEVLRGAGLLFEPDEVQGLEQDDDPRGQRHG